VLLDEPFEGIDVLAAGVIRELLRELSRRGVTLLLTTHVLEIAERLATHAGVIRGGRMLDQGPVQQLRERHGVGSLEAVFEKLISVPAARNARLSFYGEGPGAEVVPLRRGSA
jgi:ABC-2 type transport system ATP-binding protein